MHRGSRLRRVGQPEPVQDRMSRLDRVEVTQQTGLQQEQQSQGEKQPSFLQGMASFYSGIAKGVARKVGEARQGMAERSDD